MIRRLRPSKSLLDLETYFGKKTSKSQRKRQRRERRRLQLESLEERALLAGFQLLSIQPNAQELLTNGDVRNIGFTELTYRFSEGTEIDPATLSTGIRLQRSGFDGTFGDGNEVTITPNFIGEGELTSEIIVRFAETLPDDVYRIEIFGDGPTPLLDTDGNPFDRVPETPAIENLQRDFELNLGAQIIAVVPQPVSRDVSGNLTQEKNKIVVYFNNDDLDQQSAENPAFYQLILTHDTLRNTDDMAFHPIDVAYDAATDRAELTFSTDLDQLGVSMGAGGPDRTYRLRIGTDEVKPVAPDPATAVTGSAFDDLDQAGSSFTTAYDVNVNIGDVAAKSILIDSSIDARPFPLEFPGANDEPGHREVPIETHLNGDADSSEGVETYYYNFRPTIVDPLTGNILQNLINEEQKQRAREIFEIYSNYLGVQFIESASQGLTITTGDMRFLDPTIDTGPGGILGLAGGSLAIMDAAENWDDGFGFANAAGKQSWFTTAMHEIGHLLGLGHTYDLPPGTIMGDEPILAFSNQTEPVFPGDADIIHGQYLHRPESNDIDMYKFTVTQTGLFSAETFAERLGNSSLLDTNLVLFDANGNVVTRNNDYYSEDSYLEIDLTPGTYYVGVSSTGNEAYDPDVVDSGFGGTSQGVYQLRLNFRPDVNNSIVDTGAVLTTGDPDAGPQALDGDADGVPGGVYNFWFRTQNSAHTIFVDKSADPGGDGSMAAPFKFIDDALLAASAKTTTDGQGVIVRIVGNDANLPYLIGRNGATVLADGVTMDVPKNVTVMIDEGAIFKLLEARIGVGSSTASANADRSKGALQVLGTPDNSVFFTSYNDADLGGVTNPLDTAEAGDWGGLRFRNDFDVDANRFSYEDQGIFLNYVNHADLRYGGGDVPIGSQRPVVSPLSMVEARPTISFNSITKSADAAIGADPDSFKESNFHTPREQQAGLFTADYSRIGPEIHGNRIVGNSINGLYVRINTPAGDALRPLTVSGRFDDTDIVHVINENLVIQGTPGGPIYDEVVPPVDLVVLTPGMSGQVPDGTYNYKITFVDALGNETPASNSTADVTVSAGGDGSVTLTNLPTASGQFVARRIYRSNSAGTGPYRLIAQIQANGTTFVDTVETPGGELVDAAINLRARQDASLVIDPGTIVKLGNSRIEVGIGANLIAEGLEGREIIFTSLGDNTYGAGGTGDTRQATAMNTPAPGDWGGIHARQVSSLSVDHSVFRYGGGVTRLGGTAAGFNVIEVHQADARITHSVFEFNADGHGGQASADRVGRGFNDGATIFVRGAQPVVADNLIINNAGAAISINANALNSDFVHDLGRQRGNVDAIEQFADNQGALIGGNVLGGNDINGMRVRAQTLTTEGVWDDTDIVHVVDGMIYIPDFHSSGGLRLESSPDQSLVVKFTNDSAGITATGRPLDIDDRIGGGLQVIGQPGRPVVLTSFKDDTAGAGFDPQGNAQVDTNGDGQEGEIPIGPEVDNGTIIDNDIPAGVVGQFAFNAGDGGTSGYAAGYPGGGITAQGNNTLFNNQDVIFEFLNYVDVGINGGGISLANTTITMPATRVADDLVVSEGEFMGENGIIRWHAESRVDTGTFNVFNTVTFDSDQPLGNLRFINYLDEDVGLFNDDLMRVVGTPGQPDFRVFTLDGAERIGFAQGGIYQNGPGLENATYDGWAADKFFDLRDAITTTGTTYSPTGNIDLNDLVPFNDSQLGPVYGLADVTTAFAWTVDPNAMTSTVTTLTEVVPENPVSAGAPGDWAGIKIDQYAGDRNIDVVVESELPTVDPPGTNSTVDTAQFIGAIAPSEHQSDENLRLGFDIHGFLNAEDDADIYSFDAAVGTEVWFDVDRTESSLDSIIELLDSDGNVVATSNDSEMADQTTTLPGTQVNPLGKSDFYRIDNFTTNPRDAGMRVVLPGATGSTDTFYIRVRSDGDTEGGYKLQLRLRETQEIPGSTIRYADVRFADTGIQILGQPLHSPLLGEAGDVELNGGTNDILTNAQALGNIINSDRAAVDIAGAFDNFRDVDFYQFDVTYDSVQGTSSSPLSTIFDVDYASGAGGPNTTLAIYNDLGQLIYVATDSNIADDLPGPLQGANVDDLLRGSVGGQDPLLGAVNLPQGTYYLAMSNSTSRIQELEQFLVRDPVNELLRLEPIDTTNRVVEENLSPNMQVFLNDDSVVPFNLGDVVLYVSRDPGSTHSTQIFTVDPFTGKRETIVGNFARDVGDIVIRNDGSLLSLTHGTPGANGFNDANTGNYISIDPGNANITTIGDDGITTWFRSGTAPNFSPQRADVGILFDALAYREQGGVTSQLYAVGRRRDAASSPPGVSDLVNILYVFDPASGVASSTGPDRGNAPQPPLYSGAGTQIRERGEIITAGSHVDLTDVTTQNPLAFPPDFKDPFDTVSTVLDGLRFTFTSNSGADVTYELDLGPTAIVNVDPSLNAEDVFGQRTIQDGDYFNIEGKLLQFDTGWVVDVERFLPSLTSASTGLTDGDSLRISSPFGAVTLEMDSTASPGRTVPGSILIPYTPGVSSKQSVVNSIVNTINGLTGFGISASQLPGTGRISFGGATNVSVSAASQGGLFLASAGGAAPIISAPLGSFAVSDGQGFTLNDGVTNVDANFEFDEDGVLTDANGDTIFNEGIEEQSLQVAGGAMDEQQTLRIIGPNNANTFQIVLHLEDGSTITTGNIQNNNNATAVQNAVDNAILASGLVPNYAAGDLAVSGTSLVSGVGMTFDYTISLGTQDHNPITITNPSAGQTANVVTVQDGKPASFAEEQSLQITGGQANADEIQSLSIAGGMNQADEQQTLQITGAPAPATEQQSLLITGGAAGDTFILTINLDGGLSVPTAPIAFDASSATVQAAVNTALLGVAPAYANNDLLVGPGAINTGGGLTFTYNGSLDGLDHPPLGVDTSAYAAAPTVTQNTVQNGGPSSERQTLLILGGTAGDKAVLTINLENGISVPTAPIAFNATAATVQNAVNNALLGVAPGYAANDLLVGGSALNSGAGITFTYRGSLIGLDHPDLGVDTSAYIGSPTVTQNTTQDGASAFTLALHLLGGATVLTPAITAVATAAKVQSVVDAAIIESGQVPNYTNGDLAVSGTNVPSGLIFDYTGSLGGQDHGELTVTNIPAATETIITTLQGVGDTFTLSLNLAGGVVITTAPISHSAPAAKVQLLVDDAILSSGLMPTYTAGDLAVGGTDVATGLTFTYGGSLAGQDHGPLSVDTTGYIIGTPTTNFVNTQDGLGDTFTLTLNLAGGTMITTAPIPFSATAAQVEASIDTAVVTSGLTGYTPGDIAVSGTDVTTGLTLTYDGVLVGLDHDLLTLDTSGYTFGTPTASTNTIVDGLSNTIDITFHFYDATSITVSGIAADALWTDVQAKVDAALTGFVPGYAPGDLLVGRGRVHTGLQFDYQGVSLKNQNHGQLTVESNFDVGTPLETISTNRNATTAIATLPNAGEQAFAARILSAINHTANANRDFSVYGRYEAGPGGLGGTGSFILGGTNPVTFTANNGLTAMARRQLVVENPAPRQIVVNETDSAADIADAISQEVAFLSALTGANNPPISVSPSAAGARLGLRDAASVEFSGVSGFNEEQSIEVIGTVTGGTYNLTFPVALSPMPITVSNIPFDATAGEVQALLDEAFREVRDPFTGNITSGLVDYLRGDLRVGGDLTSGLTFYYDGTSVAGLNQGAVQIDTTGLMGTFSVPGTTTIVNGGGNLIFQERAAGNGVGPAGLSQQNQNIPGPGITLFPIDVDTTAAQLASDLVNGIVLPPPPANPTPPQRGLNQLLVSISAQNVGGTIEFSQGTFSQESVSPLPLLPPNNGTYTHPFVGGSVGSAGRITGLAILPLNGEMYAVDDAGGFYSVENYTGRDTARSTFLGTIDDPNTGAPINFAGLTVGPQSVENGAYANTLFGISDSGVLYAFDTTGTLLPIFLNGEKSVSIDVPGGDINGLDFSTLDKNLWHITPTLPTRMPATEMDVRLGLANNPGQSILVDEQQGAAGHGGGSSFHFGQGNVGGSPRSYDFPGGAYGVLESETFSLKGYAAADQPVLYFNYFAETGDSQDSFRVYASVASGDEPPNTTLDQWTLLASTDGTGQELFEYDASLPNTDQYWRQARIPLDQFAGLEGIRLRIEFSSAGDMNLGDVLTTGSELRVPEGTELRDGQVFDISRLSNGFGDVFFEVDLGYTLVAPGATSIDDGDQFTIDGVTFEFEDGSGPPIPGGVVPVLINDNFSARQVAQSMLTAINNSSLAGTIIPHLFQNRINLEGAANVTATGLPFGFVEGAPGISAFSDYAITINAGMTSDEVAKVIADALELAFSGIPAPPPPPLVAIGEGFPTNDTAPNAFDTGITPGEIGLHRFVGTIGDNPNVPPLLGPDDDVDLVKLDLNAGVTIDVAVNALSGGLNPYLRIFDSNGQQVAADDNSGPGGVDAALTYTVPPLGSGTYYIGVSSAPNDNYLTASEGSGNGDTTGTYELSIDFGERIYTASKRYDDVIQLIGHRANDAGPLSLRNNLSGDGAGYGNASRGQNNVAEGAYIDDIIIGFAERGEKVSSATVGNTTYVHPILPPSDEITTGTYQVEVRRGPDSALSRSYDTNDRFVQNVTFLAQAGYELVDGATFYVGDGLNRVTFEFNDTTLSITSPDYGIAPGRIEIPFTPTDPDYVIARRIRNAINSPAVQNAIDVTASLGDGEVSGTASTSNRVNLYGNAVTDVRTLEIVRPVLFDESDDLVTTLLGDSPEISYTPGNSLLFSSDNSAGIFTGGQSVLGINDGIILSTGNIYSAEPPNGSDTTSGLASQASDAFAAFFGNYPGATLENEFGVTTYDTTSLEFTFDLSTSGDISFDFVFASEEYNEFVNDIFNDAFAFFLDGVNIALIPGTTTPISINNVNGGNPFGRSASNAGLYNNNDPSDSGQFLPLIGYDGFTTRLTAQAAGLAPGTHTIRLTVSDVGSPLAIDRLYDSAVFIGANSFKFNADLEGKPSGIAGIRFDEKGDQNRFRDQGQVIVSSTSVSGSASYGIAIDAGQRSRPDLVPLAGALPHQGAVINPTVRNLERWVPGVVVVNSILDSNEAGGIQIMGDPSLTGDMLAAVPFARLINNTLYGRNNGDVGIDISTNASPTLLNNVVANFTTGIQVDASSSSTVVQGTVYQSNDTAASGVTGGLGDFAIPLTADQPLFVNAAAKNFIPASGSLIIDSSVASVDERDERLGLLSTMNIGVSPLLVPDLDANGQKRTDDPAVNPPSGAGLDPFKDRGAVDRADFIGPTALVRVPADDDPTIDRDPAPNQVNVGASVPVPYIAIQLVDGVDPNNPLDGSGIDDNSVVSSRVKVYFNGARLTDGVDYNFSYDRTNNVIRLSSTAGLFSPGVYVVVLDNARDQRVINAPDGSMLTDGEKITVTDNVGNTATLEFISGLTMNIPPTLVFPSETFTISDGVTTQTFEFTNSGIVSPGNVAVDITFAPTLPIITSNIIAAIQTTPLTGLTLLPLSGGRIYLGGGPQHSVTSASGITITGQTSVSTPGAIAVPFIPDAIFTASQAASAIAVAVQSAGLSNVPVSVNGSQVVLINVSNITSNGLDGFLSPIADLTGNELLPNQLDGSTQFSIVLGIPDSDFGDAPAPYPTKIADGGAYHPVAPGPDPLRLGSLIDVEPNGLPDDNADNLADEDGVTFAGLFSTGTATVTINVSGGDGRVDAWIDYNRDGDWEDAGEQVLTSYSVHAGANVVDIDLPMVEGDNFWARFRLSTAGGLEPTGGAVDGEVEDYNLTIGPPSPFQNNNPGRANEDVNDDGTVNFLDIVAMLSYIRTFGFQTLPHPVGQTPPPYLDPSGDNKINFTDILVVLSYLRTGGSPEGEGAASDSLTTVVATDTSQTDVLQATASGPTTTTSSLSTSVEVSPTPVYAAVTSSPTSTTTTSTTTASNTAATTSTTGAASTDSSAAPSLDLRTVFTSNSFDVSAGFDSLNDDADQDTSSIQTLQLTEPTLLDEDDDRLDDDDPWTREFESALDEIADDVTDGWQSEDAVDSVFGELAADTVGPLGDEENS